MLNAFVFLKTSKETQITTAEIINVIADAIEYCGDVPVVSL